MEVRENRSVSLTTAMEIHRYFVKATCELTGRHSVSLVC